MERDFLQSAPPLTRQERKRLIAPQPDLSIVKRQCELLLVPRSTAYYQPATGVTREELAVMHLMDKLHTQQPFLGSRHMRLVLWERHGVRVNRKRVRRLMQQMGIARPSTRSRGPARRGAGRTIRCSPTC